MALSNWDLLALDENSEPTNGIIVSPCGVQVEIYKNWLYIRDAKAWQEGGHFVEPTVMEIQHGNVMYKDVEITAQRGPKEGVYCIVKVGNYKTGYQYMVGIGCYGFNNATGDWTGIQQEELVFLRAMLNTNEWECEREEEVRNIDLTKALRFNQGDAYFADRLGEEIPATKPGEGIEPFLLTLCKDDNKGE